jgi:LexA DNA binding domain
VLTYPLEASPDFRHHSGDDVEDAIMATLTKRQKQMVDFLEHYIEEHGYAPTLAEVGQYFGLSSLARSRDSSSERTTIAARSKLRARVGIRGFASFRC